MELRQEAREALLADPLARRSVEVLAEGQAPSGAFVACPNFPTYRFSWLRDGAFCAHALDVVGQRERAAAFHAWAAASIESHREQAEEAIARVAAGETPPAEAMLPARFTLDGRRERPEPDPWPNFQVDGYGMWLWALEEHTLVNGSALVPAETVDVVARYLGAAWPLPSYSCWEEFDDGAHASTLGAVAAGLGAAARLLGRPEHALEAERVRAELLARFVRGGRFTRGPRDDRLDGSLLWLAVPFQVLPLDDRRLRATVAAVRRDLIGPGGGVRRYLGDTYYGGGEWTLLTCSLGWIDAAAGDRAGLDRCRGWVRAQALPGGDLPEQVTDPSQDPEMVEPWVERWGPVATPLLWAHAMYLLMEAAAAGARWTSSR